MNKACSMINNIGKMMRICRSICICKACMVIVVWCIAGSAHSQTFTGSAGAIIQNYSGANFDAQTNTTPVVSAILSKAGSFTPAAGGSARTFTNWSFLIDDGTGSLNVFSPLTGLNYTPTIGDTIDVHGTFAPFNAIPEVGGTAASAITSIAKTTSGNGTTTVTPLSETIPQLLQYNSIAAMQTQPYAGHLVTLSNVNIIGSGNFGTAQTSYTIVSGNIHNNNEDSMVMFYDPSNYSMAYVNFANSPIPAGKVDIIGFADVFQNVLPEFTPISMVASAAPTIPGLVYWAPGGTIGGAGVWNNSDSNWNPTNPVASGSQQKFSNAYYAVFAGAGDTIQVDPAGLTSNGIQFDSSNYVVQGGAITLGNVTDNPNDTIITIQVTNLSDTATINSQISGTSGLQKTGGGTLVLGSTGNNFTGGVKVGGGTLVITDQAELGDSNNEIKLSGGTLQINAGGDYTLGSGHSLTGVGGGLALDSNAGHTLTVTGTVNMLGALTLATGETIALANGGTKTVGGLQFNAMGTVKSLKDDGVTTDDLTENGNVVLATGLTGTSTVQATSLILGSNGASFIIPNANAKLVVTGALNSTFVSSASAHIIVSGAGTFDAQGDSTLLLNALQIGTQNAAGPTVIAHTSNSLGGANNTAGTLFFNSGTIDNESNGLITFGSKLLSSIGGTVSVPIVYKGGNMTFNGAVSLFYPTGAKSKITVENNTIFNGGWTSSGTRTVNQGLVVNSTTGNGSLTVNSSFALDAPLTVDNTKMTINAADTTKSVNSAVFAGQNGLTVQNGGTLTLGIANAFPTAPLANVAVTTGGTLATGRLNQLFGTLSVAGNAAIDFAGAAGTDMVQFADSSSTPWTASPLLRINNWTGTPIAGGGSDQLMVSTSSGTGLSATQLGEIHFTGYLGTAALLPSGEVVPSTATILKRGDINQDGVDSVADVSALIAALSDLSDYQAGTATFPGTSTPIRQVTTPWQSADLQDIVDINGDGVVNNLDIQAEINLLANHGGSPSVATVPEPSSWLLLMAGGLIAIRRKVRRRAKRSV